MNVFKKHIAILMLVGFIFPQAANAMHYVFIDHHKKEVQTSNVNLATPGYEYHYCNYHLIGLKFFNISPALEFAKKSTILKKQQQYYYSWNHKIEVAFHFKVRGPPKKTLA